MINRKEARIKFILTVFSSEFNFLIKIFSVSKAGIAKFYSNNPDLTKILKLL